MASGFWMLARFGAIHLVRASFLSVKFNLESTESEISFREFQKRWLVKLLSGFTGNEQFANSNTLHLTVNFGDLSVTASSIFNNWFGTGVGACKPLGSIQLLSSYHKINVYENYFLLVLQHISFQEQRLWKKSFVGRETWRGISLSGLLNVRSKSTTKIFFIITFDSFTYVSLELLFGFDGFRGFRWRAGKEN